MKQAPFRCLSKFMLSKCCQKEESNSSHLLPLVLAPINFIPDFIDLYIYRGFICFVNFVYVFGDTCGSQRIAQGSQFSSTLWV